MTGVRVWLLWLLALASLLVACARRAPETPTTVRETPTAVPSPALTPTATPQPTPTATPTPLPTSGYLELAGDRVVGVVVPDPQDDARYAATATALFRRSERGWERVGPLPGPGMLVSAPSDPATLYLGDHPPCFQGGKPVAFYRSQDGGTSWEALAQGQDVRPLLVHPADSRLVVGDRCQLVLSQNGGETWATLPGVEGLTVFGAAIEGASLYGVLTSEGGTTWLMRFDLSDPRQLRAGERLLEFWGGGTLLARGDLLLVAEPRGAHLSHDRGARWEFSRAGLEDVTISVDPLAESIPTGELARGYGLLSAAADPADPRHLWLGTVRGLYESLDGGATWQLVTAVPAAEIREITVAWGGSLLYLRTTEGIFVLPT